MADSLRAPPSGAIPATLGAASRGRDPVAMAISKGHRRRRGKHGRSSGGVKKIDFVGNSICPWPERLFCRLPFEYGQNLFSASAPVYYVFKIDDVWDPDPAVGGASASWVTAMGNMYMYFRVHASTISSDFTGNTANVNQYCFTWPSAQSSTVPTYAPTDVAALRAFPDAKWRIIQCEDGLGPTSTVTVEYHCDIQETFGTDIAGSVLADGSYASAPGGGASPQATSTFYWVIGAMTTNPPANGPNVLVDTRITYYVESFGMMKPDNMNLTDLEQMRIDSKGGVSLTPYPEADPTPKLDISPSPKDDFMTDSVFIEKLKAKLK